MVLRLKYNCFECGYSEIQHYRGQNIGEKYSNSEDSGFRCGNCLSGLWVVNQRFTIFESVYLYFYQKTADICGKLGLKDRFFTKPA